jgi:hypothetical protein
LVKIFSGDFFLCEIELQLTWALTLASPTMGAKQLHQAGAVQVFHLLLLLQLCACQSQVGASPNMSFIKVPKLSTTDTFSGAK